MATHGPRKARVQPYRATSMPRPGSAVLFCCTTAGSTNRCDVVHDVGCAQPLGSNLGNGGGEEARVEPLRLHDQDMSAGVCVRLLVVERWAHGGAARGVTAVTAQS